MMISNLTQFNIMLYSISAGFFIGISFDLYRVIRGFEFPNRILIFIEDILFWTLVSIMTFIFLFNKSDAVINFYVYTFIIIGIFLYILIFSKRLFLYEQRFATFFLAGIRIMFKLLTYPFRLLFNKLFYKE